MILVTMLNAIYASASARSSSKRGRERERARTRAFVIQRSANADVSSPGGEKG
jgi:hypothetical protein